MSGRADRARSAGLWLRDTGLGAAGYVLVATVAVAGWSASFVGLHQFAEAHMALADRPAWLVPVTFDGAALGLTMSVARAAMHGRGAAMWRVLVVAFTALSAWINYTHISDPAGRWVAALLPVSAVTVFESLMSEARNAYERRTGRVRPRIHPLRWLMDFGGTWAIVRAYVLDVPLPDRLTAARAWGPVRPENAVEAISAAPGWLPDVLPARPVPVASVAADVAAWPVMVSATVPETTRDSDTTVTGHGPDSTATPEATVTGHRSATGATRGRSRDRTATPRRPATKSASKPATGATDLDRVRALLADDPTLTGAGVARALGVSARTGQRLRQAVSHD